MATRKDVKSRIASVKNINKITRAMEAVAGARLRRAEQRIAALRPYAQAMRTMTRRAAEHSGHQPRVPVLEEREQIRRAGILLITGDRGLAGAFNTNIIREGMRLKAEFEAEGTDVVFSVVGRRGDSAMRFRKQPTLDTYIGFTDRPAFANAREIGRALTGHYTEAEVDQVDVIYNRYVSPLTQYVRRQTLLPVQRAEVFGEGAESEDESNGARRRRSSATTAALSGTTSPSRRSCWRG